MKSSMRIALMSGAYVNAGDFLIEQRSKRLLENVIRGAEVEVLKRNHSYNDEFDELNKYDLIIFGGGPGYQRDMYPDRMPFISDLGRVSAPVSIMGWGWKGIGVSEKYVYSDNFSENMKRFLRHAENTGGGYLGCRDWYTVRFLKNAGFYNCMMTGCPAWYDLENIEKLCGGHIKKEICQNICISDASFKCNVSIMKWLIIYLRRRYPDSRIQLVFHRGITQEKKLLVEKSFLEQYHLDYKDISGSAEGFSVYNKCDLHIGFRVHAHIYNLSRGNVSVLLNEDARGVGVNDALGILNINLKSQKNLVERGKVHRGTYDLPKVLDDYFQYIFETDFLQYENACSRIEYYYKKMCVFIKRLEDLN